MAAQVDAFVSEVLCTALFHFKLLFELILRVAGRGKVAERFNRRPAGAESAPPAHGGFPEAVG